LNRDCTGTPGEVICQDFDCQTSNYNSAGINILGGSTDADDENDPKSIYLRGLYFDGSNYLRVTGLTLHHTFTIEQWVFTMAAQGDYYSITDTNDGGFSTWFTWSPATSDQVQFSLRD
jgi:hypothetical protein